MLVVSGIKISFVSTHRMQQKKDFLLEFFFFSLSFLA
jgi:hypothetical protein